MKTPNLFDIPKSHPGRADRIKTFKDANKIWTYRCDIPRDEMPWEALLLPGNPHVELPYGNDMNPNSPLELIARYCRVLDEAGLLVQAESETKAIRELCANIGVVCDL